MALTTICYSVISCGQWRAAQRSIEVARSAVVASQGSYVTLGRKDGVVAEFIAPKDDTSDPNGDAELVIYFQNTGHVPARLAAHMTIGLAIGNPKITYKPFTDEQFLFMNPLAPARRFRKTGKFVEGDGAVIAGDSTVVFTFGTISQKDFRELPHNTAGFNFSGVYEYCDQLGNWYTHNFGMRYRPNAPTSNLSFELASDNIVPNAPLPKDTEDWEYFPPCAPVTALTNGQSQPRGGSPESQIQLPPLNP